MMDKLSHIKKTLENESVAINSLNIMSFDENSFGDTVVEVNSSIGNLRIICDRGQFFVDYVGKDGSVVPLHKIIKMDDVYSKEKWSLDDIIKKIKSNIDEIRLSLE